MRFSAGKHLALGLVLGFLTSALIQYNIMLLSTSASPKLIELRWRGNSPVGCVCGDEAERLRRLAGPCLDQSYLNISSGVPPSIGVDDRDKLREYLYPPGKKPVLDHSAIKKKKGSLQLLHEEYFFRKMIFVGVLTQQEYLHTRAKHLYDTWGKEIDKLIFFVGEDCNISSDLAYLPVIKLSGIPDRVYPPLKKTFAVMKYMYDNYLNQFNWFIRADDDVYVRPKKLKELLSQIHPYEKVYLGRAATGRKDDLKRLLLLPHEQYCMGGPGVILSVATMREVGPHLEHCLNAGEQYYSRTSSYMNLATYISFL